MQKLQFPVSFIIFTSGLMLQGRWGLWGGFCCKALVTQHMKELEQIMILNSPFLKAMQHDIMLHGKKVYREISQAFGK